MLRRSTIRVLVAGLLLMVFGLGITPKIVLHMVMADHEDARARQYSDLQEISTSGYSCDVDNIVAESPFEYCGAPLLQAPEPFFFLLFPASISSALLSEDGQIVSLRGPPCA